MSRTIILTLLPLMLIAAGARAGSKYSLTSPNGKIEIIVGTGERITYNVLLGGKALLQDGTLSLGIDQLTLGLRPVVKNAKQSSVDRLIQPVVRQKFAAIRESYNELRLEMDGGYAVVFRAYNEGAAYRFEAMLGGSEV